MKFDQTHISKQVRTPFSYVDNYTGVLQFTNYADDSDISFKSDDSTGGVTEYFRLDGGDARMYASREIRFGRLSREQALKLVKKYEIREMKFSQLFCNWLGISENSLNYILDRFRNPKYWIRTDAKSYKKNLLSSKIKIRKKKIKIKRKIHFINTNKINLNSKLNYVIFGKGYDNNCR